MIEIPRLKEAIRPFIERKAQVNLPQIIELAFLTAIINERPCNQTHLNRLSEFFIENMQGLNPKVYLIEDFISHCLHIVSKEYNVLEIRQADFIGTALIDFNITKN